MTDDTNPAPGDPNTPDGFDIEGTEPLEFEAPRRAASAEFVVEGDVGSQAAMREALDPAHQSLTDALRLSYRVLQAVMIVLVVLFVFSGIRTVREGETGVKLNLGRIQDDDGQAALLPGPHFSWPYPIGEYIVFPDKGRQADVDSDPNAPAVFWPGIRPGMDLDEMIEQARSSGILKPGRDGYLMTDGGDIGHLRLACDYRIDDVSDFVSTVDDSDPGRNADRIVRLALQRAAVHTVARMDLKELVDLDDASRAELRAEAQGLLDEIESGITIDELQTPDNRAALAIEREFRDVQSARIDSDRVVVQAQQRAEGLLIDAAGENWQALLDLIESYETAYESNDEELAEARLREVHAWLTGPGIGGDISGTIQAAESFESMVELTLGADAAAFVGMRDAYRKNPELVIATLWLEAYANVLSRDDAEVFRLADGGDITLRIKGSSAVQDLRTERALTATESNVLGAGFDPTTSRIQSRDTVNVSGPGRQLNVGEGGVTGQGGDGN